MRIFTALRRNVLVPLRDFVYPPLCFICNRYLGPEEDKICGTCWTGLTAISPEHNVWKEIVGKFHSEGYVEEFFSCFLFEKEGALQQMIHLLKYQGMKSFGVQLGNEIGKRMQEDVRFSHADLLVPVPLHKLKFRERGYNQSEFLCKGISKITTIPFDAHLLERKKYTRSQTRLTIAERKENVGNAFQVDPKSYSSTRGKTIILVDDVITTGSTINACAKELRSAGAGKIYVVSVALAA